MLFEVSRHVWFPVHGSDLFPCGFSAQGVPLSATCCCWVRARHRSSRQRKGSQGNPLNDLRQGFTLRSRAARARFRVPRSMSCGLCCPICIPALGIVPCSFRFVVDSAVPSLAFCVSRFVFCFARSVFPIPRLAWCSLAVSSCVTFCVFHFRQTSSRFCFRDPRIWIDKCAINPTNVDQFPRES